jgi:hypothetical protein
MFIAGIEIFFGFVVGAILLTLAIMAVARARKAFINLRPADFAWLSLVAIVVLYPIVSLIVNSLRSR